MPIELTKYLKAIWPMSVPVSTPDRKHLKSICTSYFQPPQPHLITSSQLADEGLEDTILRQTNFRTLRNELVLQGSFQQEAAARFECLKLKQLNNAELKQEKLSKCITETLKREQDVAKVAGIPIIQSFLKVLQHKDSYTRTIGILNLKNSI